jgi:hypothetical protein
VQEIINPFTIDWKADNAFGLGRFQSRNIFANSFFWQKLLHNWLLYLLLKGTASISLFIQEALGRLF